MPKIYSLLIAAGHGERPDGTFDIGAYNGIDKTKEHDLNLRVQNYCIKALVKNPAFDVRADQNLLRAGHEPNWAGLRIYLKSKPADLVVEIHHDAPNAKDAGFGITPYVKYVNSTPSKALAQHIGVAYAGLQLPIKPNYTDVRGLGLLKGLTMSVVIWECGITRAVSEDLLKARGEGIARGITAYFGLTYVP